MKNLSFLINQHLHPVILNAIIVFIMMFQIIELSKILDI